MTFSERIRLELSRRGMTRADLAALVGTSAASVGASLRARRPREATMLRIAAALDIPAEEVLPEKKGPGLNSMYVCRCGAEARFRWPDVPEGWRQDSAGVICPAC